MKGKLLHGGEIFYVGALGKTFPKWTSYPTKYAPSFPFLSNCGHDGRQESALDGVQVGRCMSAPAFLYAQGIYQCNLSLTFQGVEIF